MIQEKIAVVTGAGRGIGRSIALGFAETGIRVCCAARSHTEIQETASLIKENGGQAIACPTDVCSFEASKELFKFTVEHLGGVDIVVIGAGISIDKKPIEESDPEAWRQEIETNLIGAYHTAKAAIPHLKQRGAGKIIIIGSGLGHRGIPTRSAYASSKAGSWMLTRVLAQELQEYSISVNELIPGPVKTVLAQEAITKLRSQVGDGEWIKEPEDVVPLALFLAKQPDIGPTSQSFSLMRRDW